MIDNDGAVLLLEGIFQRIRDDYKILWYTKTHMENGENLIVRSSRYKGKNYAPGVYMPGVSSTVQGELDSIEEYINYVCPEYAKSMIEYLRETCEDILCTNKEGRRKIIA